MRDCFFKNDYSFIFHFEGYIAYWIYIKTRKSNHSVLVVVIIQIVVKKKNKTVFFFFTTYITTQLNRQIHGQILRTPLVNYNQRLHLN